MGMRPVKRNPFASANAKEYVPAPEADVPASVDWRTSNLVTEVKNQGSCGSCWAFSTIVSTEGQHAKKTGKLVSLSEQNLVDCVKNTDSCCNGCGGGLMNAAFDYIVAKQGGKVDTEASYGYKGANGACKFSASNAGATITGHTQIKAADEDGLKNAVGTVGPISVGVDASLSWQLCRFRALLG